MKFDRQKNPNPRNPCMVSYCTLNGSRSTNGFRTLPTWFRRQRGAMRVW